MVITVSRRTLREELSITIEKDLLKPPHEEAILDQEAKFANRYRVLIILAIIVVVGGSIVGFTAYKRLHSFWHIKVVDKPPWVSEDVEVVIRETTVKRGAQPNIFDGDLPKKVYESCMSLYWIEEIISIRKVYPNIELKMKLRTPVAYVRYGGEPYLADRKGRRLPHYYYQKSDGVPDMLYIKGIGGTPPEPGKKWGDHEALMAAIAVVEDIAGTELCQRARITTVDADNFSGRKDITYSHIVLWTENQTRILWGRSSRTPEFGDLSTREKLANLEKALEEYSGLGKVEYVNVFSVAGQRPGKYRDGE